MSRHAFRRSLARSAVLALAVQLMLVAAAAAYSGGADWPIR
jgi:hypothetical protein